MGRSVVYCPICGCPFEDISTEQIEGEFDEDILPPTQTKWLGEFRVMGRSSFTGKREERDPRFAISGPASEAEFRCVYIENRDSSGSEWTCWNGSKWRVFDQNDAGVVLYPIHDACIGVINQIAHQRSMCEQLSRPTATSYGSLESYYDALLRLHERNTEYPYGTDIEEEVARYNAYPSEYGHYKLEWEHRYYGAARFAGGSSWGLFEPGWEWICADPITIPGLTSYILNQLQSTCEKEHALALATASSLPPSTNGLMHTLQSLPIEIIASILPFLPTPATLRLRRCSKTLASKISINQTFWRNQLLFGDLIDYLWDLDPQMCHKKDKQGSWDWKTLAQILLQPKILQSALALSLHETENDEITTIFEKMSLEETEFKDAPIGLQNRCRIVRIVKDIEKMDKIEAEELVLDGEKQRHLGLLYS